MTQFSLKKGCLSGSTLKIIAIIAMAIDHFAASIILYGILMQQNPSFLGHPVSMTTVSYTHLDVYKRQDKDMEFLSYHIRESQAFYRFVPDILVYHFQILKLLLDNHDFPRINCSIQSRCV